jgi:hypothetical protein
MIEMPLQCTEMGMQSYDCSEKACDCGKRGAALSDFTKRRLVENLKEKQLQIELRIAVYGMSMRTIWPAPGGTAPKFDT